jgi:hypothetical protein
MRNEFLTNLYFALQMATFATNYIAFIIATCNL